MERITFPLILLSKLLESSSLTVSRGQNPIEDVHHAEFGVRYRYALLEVHLFRDKLQLVLVHLNAGDVTIVLLARDRYAVPVHDMAEAKLDRVVPSVLLHSRHRRESSSLLTLCHPHGARGRTSVDSPGTSCLSLCSWSRHEEAVR